MVTFARTSMLVRSVSLKQHRRGIARIARGERPGRPRWRTQHLKTRSQQRVRRKALRATSKQTWPLCEIQACQPHDIGLLLVFGLLALWVHYLSKHLCITREIVIKLTRFIVHGAPCRAPPKVVQSSLIFVRICHLCRLQTCSVVSANRLVAISNTSQ